MKNQKHEFIFFTFILPGSPIEIKNLLYKRDLAKVSAVQITT